MDTANLLPVFAHARRIMVQNIGFSLAIIALLIPLAATGVLGLATVVFIHEFAEVLVITNAIRAVSTATVPGNHLRARLGESDPRQCRPPRPHLAPNPPRSVDAIAVTT